MEDVILTTKLILSPSKFANKDAKENQPVARERSVKNSAWTNFRGKEVLISMLTTLKIPTFMVYAWINAEDFLFPREIHVHGLVLHTVYG